MMPPDYSQLFSQSSAQQTIRRKVFISHYHAHQGETDVFLQTFGEVFIRKTVGALGDQNYINSNDPEYVMRRIRADYIGDSTITIVLVGGCTHSRRYIDWEIKASLRQAQDSLPNGLIGIQMPSSGSNFHAPQRLAANWSKDDSDCYARCYRYPQSKEELRGWIEDAYSARVQRAKWIRNSHDTMLGYNRTCLVCSIVH